MKLFGLLSFSLIVLVIVNLTENLTVAAAHIEYTQGGGHVAHFNLPHGIFKESIRVICVTDSSGKKTCHEANFINSHHRKTSTNSWKTEEEIRVRSHTFSSSSSQNHYPPSSEVWIYFLYVVVIFFVIFGVCCSCFVCFRGCRSICQSGSKSGSRSTGQNSSHSNTKDNANANPLVEKIPMESV